MRLNFGEIEIDTKGLPRIYSLRSDASHFAERVNVSILLDSCQRTAVAKWAARLDVEVVDRKPYQPRPDSGWIHTYEAVIEVPGYRVKVWTSLYLEAPTVPVEDAPECPCGCTAVFCRCSDPETCVCGPACPVCDKDGGE